MPPESPRILELRRRVQADPASIAFAQLAEEYRRAGSFVEAIQTCRTGLARHPGYLSARVTLGRALIETSALDEAAAEFDLVLRSAPDNLAAIRGMAEIYQRRGQLQEALDQYKRALDLARNDPDLEETVATIGRELSNVRKTPTPSPGLSFDQAQSELMSFASRMAGPESGPVAAPPAVSAPAQSVETPAAPAEQTPPAAPAASPLVDFDDILRQLGAPDATPPPLMNALIGAAPVPVPASPPPTATHAAAPATVDAVAPQPPGAERDREVLQELEDWLLTLQDERKRRESSEP